MDLLPTDDAGTVTSEADEPMASDEGSEAADAAAEARRVASDEHETAGSDRRLRGKLVRDRA